MLAFSPPVPRTVWLLFATLGTLRYSLAAVPLPAVPQQQATGIEQGTGRHIPYHINSAGHAVAFGDIIIGRHVTIQQQGIRPIKVVSARKMPKPPLPWGTAASYWPNNTVFYTLTSAQPATRTIARQAMQQIESKSALRFVKRTTEEHYIALYTTPPGECSASARGMQGQQQSLGIGSEPRCARVRTALHALMHALGAGHVYLRPDRDRFITVTQPSYATQINPSLDIAQPFDYASVTNDPLRIRAILPERQRLITDYDQLSKGDIRFLQQAYPAKDASNISELRSEGGSRPLTALLLQWLSLHRMAR